MSNRSPEFAGLQVIGGFMLAGFFVIILALLIGISSLVCYLS